MEAQRDDGEAEDSLAWATVHTRACPAGGPAGPAAAAPLGLDEHRYLVAGEVARGGMGRILAATDLQLGRQVAIKCCLSTSPICHERLLREAAILSQLDHPAIPPVYELGRLRDGGPYFATRLIDGVTLEERLAAAPAAWPALLPAIAAVAEAMAGVHARGIIHRDLKPRNILIDRGGEPVIIDWGIGRVLRSPTEPVSGPAHDLQLTAPGTPVGTPGYWAPEQQRGESGDAATDVYGLGAILYRMVTGRTARGHVPTGDALTGELRAAPRWLRRVIATATAPEPARRYASAAALAGALRRGLGHRSARGGRWLASPQVLIAVLAATCVDLTPTGAEPEAPVALAELLGRGGYWKSNFGDTVFAVDGDRVRAVYRHDAGVFEGRIDGDRIVGYWCEPPFEHPRDSGHLQLALLGAGDGAVLVGRWGYGYQGPFADGWELTPVTDAPRLDLVARLTQFEWRCVPPTE